MTSKITAGTTAGTSLNMSADTSGQLEVLTGATPSSALVIDGSQNSTFTGFVSAKNGPTGGFYSTTYAVNQSNNIWAFGDAPNYGLKYFQGTSGTATNSGNADTIALPFGQTTSGASFFQFVSNGSNLGALVMPNQPAFIAQINANSDATFNSGSYVPFNITALNRGSYFSTSNYYFTAPVTGAYQFTASLFLTSSAGATGNMQFGLTKNGTFQNSALDVYNCANITPNNTGGTAQINATGIFTLNAGDVVGVQPRTASIRVYQGHCYFSGQLIG